METSNPVAFPLEIASVVTDNSYISHHSAFEFYGLANQAFADIYVSTPYRFREFVFDDRQYHCIKTDHSFGITEQKMIRATDLERTILDGIKDFDKIGGLEELLRCLAMVTAVREDVLIQYLGLYNNYFLAQKTGYLLSFFPRMKLSEEFFNYCKVNKGNSYRYLYQDLKNEKCVFSKEWNLCISKNIMKLVDEGGEPLV